MYILLEEGMKIKFGDEHLDDKSLEWEDMDGFLFFGHSYQESFHVPIRRKINTIEELITSYNNSKPTLKK